MNKHENLSQIHSLSLSLFISFPLSAVPRVPSIASKSGMLLERRAAAGRPTGPEVAGLHARATQIGAVVWGKKPQKCRE